MKNIILILGAALAAACSATPAADPGAARPQAPAAPWTAARLGAADAPAVLLTQWSAAANRASCAPLSFSTLGAQANATPRAATFSGGWGVAWDLPELRSAFGIAGTGATPDANTYDDWPHHVTWADGSRAGYGPEGGSGPRQLAYLRIAGQSCLYNVWSNISREHLEQLLQRLRFVHTP